MVSLVDIECGECFDSQFVVLVLEVKVKCG